MYDLVDYITREDDSNSVNLSIDGDGVVVDEKFSDTFTLSFAGI